MHRLLVTEIIARGKRTEDKAWRKKRNERLEEMGYASPRTYSVMGREARRVMSVWPEFEARQDWEAFRKAYRGDEKLREFERERGEQGIVVEGTTEVFVLTDY